MALTIRGYPRRAVFDWVPADGHHAAWLACLERDGWVLDFGSTKDGSRVLLGGREVVRHAMRESEPARHAREVQRAQGAQESALAQSLHGLTAVAVRDPRAELFEGGWWEHAGDGHGGSSGDDSPGWPGG